MTEPQKPTWRIFTAADVRKMRDALEEGHVLDFADLCDMLDQYADLLTPATIPTTEEQEQLNPTLRNLHLYLQTLQTTLQKTLTLFTEEPPKLPQGDITKRIGHLCHLLCLQSPRFQEAQTLKEATNGD